MHRQSVFPLHLRNILRMHIQTIRLLNIRLNLLIGSFFRHIFPIHSHFNIYSFHNLFYELRAQPSQHVLRLWKRFPKGAVWPWWNGFIQIHATYRFRVASWKLPSQAFYRTVENHHPLDQSLNPVCAFSAEQDDGVFIIRIQIKLETYDTGQSFNPAAKICITCCRVYLFEVGPLLSICKTPIMVLTGSGEAPCDR